MALDLTHSSEIVCPNSLKFWRDPQRCEPRKATSGSALEIRVAQDTALFRLDSSQPFCDVRLLENQEAEALLLEVAIASVAGTP